MKQAAVFLIVLSFSAVAAAQAPAQPPAPSTSPSPERANEPRKPSLNLKLDEADLRSLPRSPASPDEQKPADALPSLGGDARAIGGSTRSADRPSSNRPFPQDTENVNR